LRREPSLAYVHRHTDTHRHTQGRTCKTRSRHLRYPRSDCSLYASPRRCMYVKNFQKKNTNINTHRVWKHSTAVFKHAPLLCVHAVFKRRCLVCTLCSSAVALCARTAAPRAEWGDASPPAEWGLRHPVSRSFSSNAWSHTGNA
jgi:hypothetical protein